MKLFEKNKKTSEQTEPAIEEKQAVQTRSISSGRLTQMYQRMYQWVFSVNVSRDVYQIESGKDQLAGENLPVRGYYHELLEQLAAHMNEGGERLKERFGADNVIRLAENGWTSVSDLFCGEAWDGCKGERWYELRLEWVIQRTLVCVMSVRPVVSDLDNGQRDVRKAAAPLMSSGSHDWNALHAQIITSAPGTMVFEYNVQEDRLELHRTPDDAAGDEVHNDFTKSLLNGANRMASSETAPVFAGALQCNERSTVIVALRKGAARGGSYNRYRLHSFPIEENGNIQWVIGWLEDVEAQLLEQDGIEEMSCLISDALNMSKISLFLIDCGTSTITRVRQRGKGYSSEDKSFKLADYIRTGISTGRIHAEDAEAYLKWLEKDFLRRKTGTGVYSFDARIKGLGDEDYLWYQESIIPVEGKKDVFLRLCRENTMGHLVQESEYHAKEMQQIAEYNGQMLDMLSGLLEFRTANSNGHIEHVRRLTRIILEDVNSRSVKYNLTPQQINRYVQASTMHDIGKITVPDHILNKPALLTPEEMKIMSRHTVDGAEIIKRIKLPGQEELYKCIMDVVLHHHERVDGNGYPDGLKADSLSIGVQAVSMADVLDALVSERCYKRSYSFDEAMRMINEGECGAFSPEIMDSLRNCEDKLRAVYREQEVQRV